MNLQTGLVITRDKVWEQPLTDPMIRAVKTMAKEQGIKTLQLTGRNKIPIYPANWIAAVEYEENEKENENKANEDKNNEKDYRNEAPDYEFDEKAR
jgi:hypothetical protein